MMPTKEDLVPGGRWVSVPGTDTSSSLYALSLAMVTDSSRTRAPIWDSPATEVLAYDLLKGIWETDVILCCHELRASQPSEFTSFLAVGRTVDLWNQSTQSHIMKCRLYIEKEAQIIRLCDPQVKTYNNVLIRYANGCWEAFTYFKQDMPENLVDKPKLSSVPSHVSSTQDPSAAHQDTKTSGTIDQEADLRPITAASDTMERLDAQLSDMESLAISLNSLEPQFRSTVQPRLDKLISALRCPDYALSATSSDEAVIQDATASQEDAGDGSTRSRSYEALDHDDSCSDSN